MGRYVLAGGLVVGLGLGFGAGLGAPGVAGASTHKSRATTHKSRRKSPGVEVKVVSSSKYGKILVSSSGRALYTLVSKSGKALPCRKTCTSIWPPFTTKGKPRAGSGVDAKVLRTRGRQVTYDGRPLYFFSGDTKSGVANGEGIVNFGGTWYLLAKTGKPVKVAHTASKKSGGSSSSSSGSGSGSSGSGSSW